MWAQLLERIGSVQPTPSPGMIALLGLVALALIVLAWPTSRLLVTIAHEGGHGVLALLTGRKLTGIRLHRDTSGLTVSKGRASGPGMVATLAAGYPMPALVGLGAAWMLDHGRAVALMWALVVFLGGMLLMIRNFYGALVMLLVLGAVGAASWYLAPVQLSWLAYALTWFWLFAAPRPVWELARQGGRNSDSAQLARITGIPAGVWTFCFGLLTLACLGAGVTLLVPGLTGA